MGYRLAPEFLRIQQDVERFLAPTLQASDT